MPLEPLGAWPSDWLIQGIDLLHTTSGMPYWASIITLTLAVRTALFPLIVYQSKLAPQMQRVQKTRAALAEQLKKDPNQSAERQRMYNQQIMKAGQVHGVGFLQPTLVPLLQIPIFMSFFYGIKKMGLYYPEFAQGGLAWFTDLGVAGKQPPNKTHVTVLGLRYVPSPLASCCLSARSEMQWLSLCIFRTMGLGLSLPLQPPSSCSANW